MERFYRLVPDRNFRTHGIDVAHSHSFEEAGFREDYIGIFACD